MSDSMAFLAGVAFAGIAALLLLKGGGIPNQSISPTSLPPPPPSVMPSTQPLAQLPTPPALPSYNTDQQRDIERLKAQIDRQQMDTQLLKEQLRNQQLVIDSLNAQLKANNLNSSATSQPVSVTAPQPATPILWGLLWAMAGMLVSIVIAIILVAVFIIIWQQHRYSRTMQVFQPFNSSEPFQPYKRRSEFLPPRIKGKRVEPNDYER